MKTLNSYRNQVKKDIDPSGNQVHPRQALNHFIDSLIEQRKNPPKEIECRKLADSNEEMQKVWLQFIIILATSYLEADCLKLIDANFFFENKISDDKEASQLIIDTINMMKQYDRSVVIFDIDSIAGVTKEFSSIKKDVSQATNSAVEDGEGSTFNF